MPRFSADILDLQSGFGFITLALTMLALPEEIYLILDPNRSEKAGGSCEIKDLSIAKAKAEAKSIAPVIAWQSIQGVLIGVLSGTRSTIASLLGYAVERNLTTKEGQDQFGKGTVKGPTAPESANNAACTESFVPLLTIGIPGSGTTAIMLGTLIGLNASPRPRLMVDNLRILWNVIILMSLGNSILPIMNLPPIPYIVIVLTPPRNYLISYTLFLNLIDTYIGQNNANELLILIGLGVIVTAFRFADYPLSPLLACPTDPAAKLPCASCSSMRRAAVRAEGDIDGE